MRLSELFEKEMRGRKQCFGTLHQDGRYCALGLVFKGKGFTDAAMDDMWSSTSMIQSMAWYKLTRMVVCSCSVKSPTVGILLEHLNDDHHMSFVKILENILRLEAIGIIQEGFQ